MRHATKLGKNCPAEISTHEQLAPAATVRRRDFTTDRRDDEPWLAPRSLRPLRVPIKGDALTPALRGHGSRQGYDSIAGTWLALYVWRGTPTWQTEST